MRLVVICAIVGSLNACGSSSGSPSPTSEECESLMGLYHIVYFKQSGDCPNIPDRDVVLPTNSPSGASPSCSITASSSTSDYCSGSLTEDCFSAHASEHDTITFDISQDASQWHGTLEIQASLPDGSICSGNFMFSGNRTHR